MCARRFLLIVFLLILLAVAGAFAIFQWGGQVLMRQATPKGHFEPPPPSSGPDYSQPASWIARPDLVSNPSTWRPEGAPTPTAGAASVFYVHPTTYLKRDRWNAPLAGDPDADSRARLFVQSQASALADAGPIWAPRYRQAAYGAFLLKSEDAQKALDLAYGDVRAAFDEFLRHNAEGALILAGHSQGSLHLSHLLQDYGPRLRTRLVAAYVVGWPLSATADLPAMGLDACSAPDETGCILSWQSFAEPANPDLILDAWEGTASPTGRPRRRADMLCVNPLTGIEGGTAPPNANPGTLVPTANLTTAQLVPGRVGARCENGFLLLSGRIPTLGPFVLPGNNYHVYDYALFWSAIRADSARRVRAWQAR